MAGLCLLQPRLDELFVLLLRPRNRAPAQGPEGCADSGDTPDALLLAPLALFSPAGPFSVLIAVFGVVASPRGLLRRVWPQPFHGPGK